MRTIYTKANDMYCKNFQLGTAILEDSSGHRLVKKFPLCEEAKPHLNKMKQGFDAFGGRYGQYVLAPVRQDSEGLHFDYISGETGTTYLLNALKKDGTTGVLREMKKLLENLPAPDCEFVSSADFCSCFGEERIPQGIPACSKSFFDFTSGNIILQGKQWFFIDYEWFFPFPVPVDLMKVHFVECLYTDIQELPQALEKEEIYAYLEISNTEQFRRCREYFLERAVMNENSMSQISGNYLKAAYPLCNSQDGTDILQKIKTLEEQRDYQVHCLEELQHGMEEKDSWIAEQESQLAYQSQVIAQREEAIAQKDNWIAEQGSQLAYQSQVIAQREEAIAQKDNWIAEQGSQLEYQSQVIAQREEAIAQKDNWIAEQSSQLEYQSQVIAQQEEALRQKENWIQEQGMALAQKVEEIARLEEKIEEEHQKRLTFQQRLYTIENSKFWQYTAAFHKKLDEKEF